VGLVKSKELRSDFQPIVLLLPPLFPAFSRSTIITHTTRVVWLSHLCLRTLEACGHLPATRAHSSVASPLQLLPIDACHRCKPVRHQIQGDHCARPVITCLTPALVKRNLSCHYSSSFLREHSTTKYEIKCSELH
jgi:hypothetical protein